METVREPFQVQTARAPIPARVLANCSLRLNHDRLAFLSTRSRSPPAPRAFISFAVRPRALYGFTYGLRLRNSNAESIGGEARGEEKLQMRYTRSWTGLVEGGDWSRRGTTPNYIPVIKLIG